MTHKTFPDDTHEKALRAKGYQKIAGVDEVGRGPLAGPVLAAAVVLDLADVPQGLNDSKKLSATKRADLCAQIKGRAQISYGLASVAEIDTLNILHASLLAMRRALEGLPQSADFALIDGNRLPPDLPLPATALVKGDSKSVSIAAASIMAKISRDAIMQDLAKEFPAYGWEKNAGYPTKTHLNAIADVGISPHHRRSFKPVHNILIGQNS